MSQNQNKTQFACVDCIHHKATARRRWYNFFRKLVEHDCYVRYNEPDRVTGEPIKLVRPCDEMRYSNYVMPCHFESVNKQQR